MTPMQWPALRAQWCYMSPLIILLGRVATVQARRLNLPDWFITSFLAKADYPQFQRERYI
jgi:hypothetical protein